MAALLESDGAYYIVPEVNCQSQETARLHSGPKVAEYLSFTFITLLTWITYLLKFPLLTLSSAKSYSKCTLLPIASQCSC